METKTKTNEELVLVLKTFYGLEQALKEELEELGYENIEVLNRAVRLKGTWNDVYKLNLYSRCALSVLVELSTFQLKEDRDLYKEALKIDWTQWFNVDKTFVVKGAVHSSLFSHSQFPFLLVKDAVVDCFRDKVGDRPDINVKSPQLVIDVYVREKEGVLSINTSGAPLFHRGYRESTGEAPLNEVVAAGLIRMSGWDRKSTFFDPFCGSGTLLIEAALLALGIPSSIERTHYAFKNLKNYSPEIWQELHDGAHKVVRSMDVKIIGSDIDPQMVLITKRNLRGFSFGRFIDVKAEAFQEVEIPEGPGVLVTNPPYGERLMDNIEELYADIGTTFKFKMQGYNCWMISSSEEGFKSVGLKPSRKIKLFNGDLECSFRNYVIFDGAKKDLWNASTDSAAKEDASATEETEQQESDQ